MSVGHVQRAVEKAGIATTSVFVASFAHVARLMSVPRAVVAHHPMGRPLGAPHDFERQVAVVRAALDLVDSASEPQIVDLSDGYRPAPPG